MCNICFNFYQLDRYLKITIQPIHMNPVRWFGHDLQVLLVKLDLDKICYLIFMALIQDLVYSSAHIFLSSCSSFFMLAQGS